MAVRTLVFDGKRYVYLVNRDYYPVSVKLQIGNASGDITDLSNHQTASVEKDWQITLGPYELRSFAMPEQVRVEGFLATPPPQIEEQLKAEAADVAARIEQAKKEGKGLPPGAESLAGRIKQAAEDGRLAWLRRALHSYPILKSRQLFQ